MIHSAQWIWSRRRKHKADVYMCFRRTFILREPGRTASLEISADSDFVAWLNGAEIARGQFSDFAATKTYGHFAADMPATKGANVLAVLVHHRGEDFFEHQAGTPGLIAAFKSGGRVIKSGDGWKVLPHPAFRSGQRERMTPQCGFTFQFDARKDENWTELSYDDRHWEAARIAQESSVGRHWKKLSPRPLPSLAVGALFQGSLVIQGSVFRPEKLPSAAAAVAASALRVETPESVFCESAGNPDVYDGPPKDPARFLASDSRYPLIVKAPPAGFDGRFFIMDLGKETVGLLEFTVDGPEGTVIEIAHGEHLDDGRVRARIGERNFADRYICRGGVQAFQMPFRRLGARYLEMHVLGKGETAFHSLGLRTVEYPAKRKGGFRCSDRLTNRLHEMATRTLELCRHEHYEDSPWREQSLYAYDARLQALYGYYAFGDYDFPAVSLGLLGETFDPKIGLISLTAPGKAPVNIPIFSFVWVTAIAEHWLYSGSPAVFEKYRETIALILEKALHRKDPRNGLCHPPEEAGCWHFYEWAPGLSGQIGGTRLQGAHHAAYNLHLLEAVRSHAEMLARKGEHTAAQKEFARAAVLRKAIHRGFWDGQAGLYRSELLPKGGKRGAHELVQALALCEAIAPRNAREKVSATLAQGRLASCTLSAAFYLLRSVLQDSGPCRDAIRRRLSATWEKMLLSGAGTLWETEAGGRDFAFAGSLCHGWSALPVYFHQAVVLGVSPVSPGFECFKFQVDPCAFAEASGEIPTPFGKLKVRWRNSGDGLVLEAHGPKRLSARASFPPVVRIRKATYNGFALC